MHLRLGVMVVVDSRGPLGSLAVGEDRPRHFKFARLACQRCDIFLGMFASSFFCEPISNGKKRIERNEALVV